MTRCIQRNQTTPKGESKLFHLKRMQLFALAFGISLPALLIISLPGNAGAERAKADSIELAAMDTGRFTMQLGIPKQKEATQSPLPGDIIPNNKYHIQTITVKKGDTLTRIFRRAGLGAQHVYRIAQLNKKTQSLAHLSPGQSFDFTLNDEKALLALVYHIDNTHKLIIKKVNGKFQVSNETREYETRTTYASGEIKTSLFDAANKAGLSDNLTMDLAYIFGWDIDFALDIRQGDQFAVLYEELYLDGERVKDGNILAAEFINRGKSFKAVRYTDKMKNSGYYSENGNSMRKAFLRSPVDFTRISSRFGKRHHPILKKRKSHKGVDYAAPRGTPVKAAGDGKIIWRGRKGGYGKAVIIKHANRYSTLYAHLNSYNRKAKRGSRVKQGQIIGYVGSTGRATGPHLHYEFRVNGVHRNPLTVKLPNTASIQKKYRADFLSKARPLLAQLALIKNTSLALTQTIQ